jgi:TIR domain
MRRVFPSRLDATVDRPQQEGNSRVICPVCSLSSKITPWAASRVEAPDAAQAGRYDAFISYARADGAFAVDRLSRALGARGYEVWLEVHDIPGGAKWRDRVRRGIEACKVFVFVISPDSVTSDV